MKLRVMSVLWIAFTSCDPTLSTPDAAPEPPVILAVIAPSPALEGSVLEVRGVLFETLGTAPLLEIDQGPVSVGELERLPDDDATDGVMLFELSGPAASVLGPGTHEVEVRVTGNGIASRPFTTELPIVTSLPVALVGVPSGEAFRNDLGVVSGAGILSESEGELAARFTGTFTLDAGGASEVDVELPVAPLERGDRTRGVIVLTTALGGLMPGTFEGEVQLTSRLRSGETSESATLATTLHFNRPELFSLDPTSAALGQILRVRGGGFLGGPDRPTETSLIRLVGTFTPAGGGLPEPLEETELVPRYVSGNEVELVMEHDVRGGALVSSLFGHARGTFVGTATPIAIAGTQELEGDPVPFMFTLGALRQVVHVRFLPGFFDSLRRFGLASAAPQIIDRVRARMENIYAQWNVDFRFDEPDDFARTSYSVLEIGGPDPNGSGLFGYDNTPGKDIGNLRLFDSIGGTNATTQADGYPGYGGVFVDSFLYWSSHPDLPGQRPSSAPDAEPLFDEIFDPVRTRPATRAEALGEGEPDRVAAVRRAVHALGSLIGETASHELGHSLGMAQPYGPPHAYHNDFDGEGCLMDSGGNRPLGERMELPGFAPTQFCHEHPSYLSEILAR